MYDSGPAINNEGSSRRTISVTSGNSRVNQGDDSTSRGIGGREMNSMRGKYLLESGKVIVRGSTNILNTNNIISIQKGLEMRDDLEVTRDQTTRETEAARVNVSCDNGGEFELGNRVIGGRIGGSELRVNVLTGIDLHGLRS